MGRWIPKWQGVYLGRKSFAKLASVSATSDQRRRTSDQRQSKNPCSPGGSPSSAPKLIAEEASSSIPPVALQSASLASPLNVCPWAERLNATLIRSLSLVRSLDTPRTSERPSM